MSASIIKLNVLLLFLFLSISGIAQVKQPVGKPAMDSKFYIGGGLGLSFGNETTIYVAPELAYAVSENLHIGAGISYEYHNIRNYNPRRIISIYGGKVFGRYFILENFFVQAEFEKLFYRDNYINPNNQPLLTNEGVYIGGGYRQWMGSNSFYTIALLFNVMDDNYIFGINPFIRIGISIGI